MLKGIIDTNILVYAYNRDSVWHKKAKKWLESLDTNHFVVTWQNLLEFYSTITNSHRVEKPISVVDATKIITEYLNMVDIVYPNKSTGKIFSKICLQLDKRGSMVFDLFLASTALANGITTIYTVNTKDFEGIEGFTAINPL